MAEDMRCWFNINSVCYEMVAHGFTEEFARESGKMKKCDMGSYNGTEITDHYLYIYGVCLNCQEKIGNG